MVELIRKNPETEDSKIIEISPQLFEEGKLFASQNWVLKPKIPIARSSNMGTYDRHLPMPLVYPFMRDTKMCFLIGDGHHRAADALLHGLALRAEQDDYLGMIPDEILTNPRLAERKFAKYGITGIWPFAEYLKSFEAELKKLS